MPAPKKGEKKKEFLGRCMGHPHTQKWEAKQRYAVCNAFWDKRLNETIKPSFKEYCMEAFGPSHKIEAHRSSVVKRYLPDLKLQRGERYNLVTAADNDILLVMHNNEKILDEQSRKLYDLIKNFIAVYKIPYTIVW